MPYQYYQEWGIVDSFADMTAWLSMLVILVLSAVVVGISAFLLNRQRFRMHILFLVVMAVALTAIGLSHVFGGLGLWLPDVFLVLCLWDHYWARNRLGQSPVPLEKAKRIQVTAAVILAACGVLLLAVGPLFALDGQDLGKSLLVAAGYVVIHSYFHRNHTTAEQFDRLP